jgi:hypothetical protein
VRPDEKFPMTPSGIECKHLCTFNTQSSPDIRKRVIRFELSQFSSADHADCGPIKMQMGTDLESIADADRRLRDTCSCHSVRHHVSYGVVENRKVVSASTAGRCEV